MHLLSIPSLVKISFINLNHSTGFWPRSNCSLFTKPDLSCPHVNCHHLLSCMPGNPAMRIEAIFWLIQFPQGLVSQSVSLYAQVQTHKPGKSFKLMGVYIFIVFTHSEPLSPATSVTLFTSLVMLCSESLCRPTDHIQTCVQVHLWNSTFHKSSFIFCCSLDTTFSLKQISAIERKKDHCHKKNSCSENYCGRMKFGR